MALHFKDHMQDLMARVARMTAQVQLIVEQSVEAVIKSDVRLAQQTMAMDRRIDEDEVEIEKAAISLLALYQPAAVDLRMIASVIKVNADFERIADCAVNCCQRVASLAGGGYEAPSDLRLMAHTVVSNLRDTIKAFNLADESIARQVLRSDDVVDALYHQIVQDMLMLLESDHKKANTDLSNVMIAKNLERIADHCTNIAEDVIYVHTGRIIRHLHATG